MSIRHCLSLLALLLMVVSVLSALPAWAQDEAAPEPEANPDQEVGVSEENYRRHMELGDVQLERNNFPVTDYAAQAELQKMVRLPEASQRHLRDELRDIIVQGGAWSPAEADKDYPFVPSAAARGDGELRRLESEAWEELVGQYHAREAQLQAGAQGIAGQQGREGEKGQEGPAGSEGQQANAAPADNAATRLLERLPGGPGQSRQAAAASELPTDPVAADAQGQQGVEQSALEFLTAAAGSQQSQGQASQAATSQAAQQSESQQAQQPESQQAQQQTTESQQAQAQQSESQQAAAESQQADQKSRPEVEYQEQDGVLAIRDLDKARGVAPAEGEEQSEEDEEQEEERRP